MRVDPQPHGRRGTVGHAYSALNLRLALAVFGLLLCVVGAVLLFLADLPGPAWLLLVLAAVTVADIVVIQARRRARRHTEGDGGRSLFE